ncbi:helix-turn-helix domain-containing protein [Paenibacillus sp. MSJ-34]|uniref:helix-turn-helix domain-containing protein n=1 Tax=Paenibacillus sp. MSJ-34 TaxID=2841529 RepID=UPI001C121CE7|nr:helix-turn-helix domain-containing protein [Paenibacillus sp. MSJ-34]MBU5442747.1 helix-turn-helix domain-containing protein [Paenibacillus sp. MSJ-34]
MRKNDLFELVHLAQNGNRDALYEVISIFLPAIRSASYKVKYDRQEDLMQHILEVVIKKILSYDMSRIPNFSEFCENLKTMSSS